MTTRRVRDPTGARPLLLPARRACHAFTRHAAVVDGWILACPVSFFLFIYFYSSESIDGRERERERGDDCARAAS